MVTKSQVGRYVEDATPEDEAIHKDPTETPRGGIQQISRRLDYILVKETAANLVKKSRILREEELGWKTDHRGTYVEMLNLSLTKDIGGTEWVKPTFDFLSLMEKKEAIKEELEEWAQQEVTQGKESLNNMTQRVISRLIREGVKRKKEWKVVGKREERTEESRRILEEIGLLEALLKAKGGKEKEMKERIQVLRREGRDKEERGGKGKIARAEVMAKELEGKPATITEMEEVLREERQLWKRRLRRQRGREEVEMRLLKEEKIRASGKCPEWASEIWKKNKRKRKVGMGISVLEDSAGRIKTGEQTEEAILEYTNEMWGKSEELSKPLQIKGSTKAEETEMGKMLNRRLSRQEVQRAINRLKKKKTPGEDLVPNEIYSLMTGKILDKFTRALEECRITNEFPESWKETELRWIYKKDDPLKIKTTDQ